MVAYLGTTEVRQRRREVIRVIDTRYGLQADHFAAPAERRWAARDMLGIIAQHVGRRDPPRAVLGPLYQAWQPETPTRIQATPLTIELLDTYLRRKLAAVGMLSPAGRWQLRARIDRYYQTQTVTGRPPWRQVEIELAILPLSSQDAFWQGRFVRRWSLGVHPQVDDVLADQLTSDILDLLARGWRIAQQRGAALDARPARDR